MFWAARIEITPQFPSKTREYGPGVLFASLFLSDIQGLSFTDTTPLLALCAPMTFFCRLSATGCFYREVRNMGGRKGVSILSHLFG